MRRLWLGTAFAVFVLFFGIETLEALQTRNWLKAGFFLAVAIVFVLIDNLRTQDRSNIR